MPEPNILVFNIVSTICIAGIKLVVINTELIHIEQLGLLKFLFFKMLN